MLATFFRFSSGSRFVFEAGGVSCTDMRVKIFHALVFAQSNIESNVHQLPESSPFFLHASIVSYCLRVVCRQERGGGGGYSFHAQSASYETWGCISKRDTCRAGVSVACSIDYCVHANKENALHAYQAVRCVGALFLVVLRHMCIAYRKVVARC